MSNIKRYSPTTIGDSDDRQFMGMFEFDDGKYCAYEDVDASLAAKDARIADLEQAIYDLRYAHRYAPTCQAGVVAKCQCWNCVVDRAVFPAAQQQAEPATHSEDGRDSVQVVAFLMKPDFYEPYVSLHRDSQTSALCEPLMTVAQHERIVAAKDAEIASERELRRQLSVRVHELKDDAKAQPARQVGGDERAAFNAWNNGTDCPLAGRDTKTGAWMAWQARAALAPAAVVCVMPEPAAWLTLGLKDGVVHRSSRTDKQYPIETVLKHWGDQFTIEQHALVRADEVARLNRRAIPAGLLNKLLVHVEARERQYDEIYTEGDELRALLGKEGE